MSLSRSYMGDRSSLRGRRKYNRYVPVSRHTIFIRRLPASIQPKAVKNFFAEETNSNCDIDFVSYTEDKRKLCVAIRFDSHYVARDMIDRYNNREVLGHIVEVTWFKDLQSAKDRFEASRRGGRYPRRGGGGRFRSARSGSRGYAGSRRRYRESSRDRKSRSRTHDSASSSSSSKSRSGSESDSARSSGSPARLIRDINKEKYNSRRRRSSRGSYGSGGHGPQRGPPNHPKRQSRERSFDNPEGNSPSRKWPRRLSPVGPGYSRSSWGKEMSPPMPQVAEVVSNSTVPEIPTNKMVSLREASHESANRKRDIEPDDRPHKPSPILPTSVKSNGNVMPLFSKNDDPGKLTMLKNKSQEILDNFHSDIEKYLTFVNTIISRRPEFEEELVSSLKSTLTELGENYVSQFADYIENIPRQIETIGAA